MDWAFCLKNLLTLVRRKLALPFCHPLQVSAFGENGKGDDGDNWQVVCSSDLWYKSSAVRLRHVITSKYLTVPGGTYGRPIAGQYEITGTVVVLSVSLLSLYVCMLCFYL